MNVLVIFARYPEPGKVKSRLAANIGEDAACRIYERMLRDQIQEHRDRAYDLVAFTASRREDFAVEFRVPAFAQRGVDLGERMADAFDRMLCTYDTVAIAGSDVPGLTCDLVEQSFSLAGRADVVLGPCPDGGYYLIASRSRPDLFTDVPWGTGRVLERTLEQLRAQRRTWGLLPPERDVDEARDLENFRHLAGLA